VVVLAGTYHRVFRSTLQGLNQSIVGLSLLSGTTWSIGHEISLKDRYGEPEGGSEWEPIKILLEVDRSSNKMNSASNTHLRLNYPSWSRPHSHWSATDPRNQQTTFRDKTHQHAQRKLARLAACATPVRLMACAGQTGGRSWSGRWLQ
jgi:hypothetical protein